MSKVKTVYGLGWLTFFTSKDDEGRICAGVRLTTEDGIEVVAAEALVAAAKAGVAAAQAAIDAAFKQEASDAS